MKIPYFLILTVCAANVYAEPPRLPPVLDNSTYNDAPLAPAPQQPAASYDEPNNIDSLKNDVSELKRKVQEQEEAIERLKYGTAEPHKKPDAAATSRPPELVDMTFPAAPVKSVTGAENEKERYQHASELLKKGDYVQAISEFQGIIKTYPTGQYADNAQYWIGVALLNKGDKKAAIQAFDRVARVYPKSEKAPEALYKLADTLLSIKNKAKAKEYFDYVIQTYPGTTSAALAAKKKAAAKL